MLFRTLLLAVSVGLLLGAVAAEPVAAQYSEPLVLAQVERDGELEPRYEPREPVPEPAHDSSLVFSLTRGVADSAIAPAGKVPLYVFTIPLDIALLPFAFIGGFF